MKRKSFRSNGQYIAGVDLGGSTVRTGLITRDRTVVPGDVQAGIPDSHSTQIVLSTLFSSLTQLLDRHELTLSSLAAVGIGAPGPLDLDRGIILTPPNLPVLHHYPVCERIKSYFNRPVFLQNDANCFTLGEVYCGHGRRCAIVVGITQGTGLGCGLCLNGQIYTGATGTAMEIWGSRYRDGTVEDYISGQGLSECYGRSISAEEAFERASKGEKKAIQAWKKFGNHTGICLSLIVNHLDPDLIVIGGSVSKASGFYKESLRNSMMDNINYKPQRHVKIRFTKKPDQAGWIGAASFALHSLSV